MEGSGGVGGRVGRWAWRRVGRWAWRRAGRRASERACVCVRACGYASVSVLKDSQIIWRTMPIGCKRRQ